jgi:hypothetical protein
MKKGESMARHVLLAACISQVLAFSAHATLLEATIDTSSLIGTNAQIASDFIAGDGSSLNTVTISHFSTDATLGTATATGSATGDMRGTVSLQSASFFNEVVQPVTLGNRIRFNLNLTENFSAGTTTPDALSVFLLDSQGNPIIYTTDPTGSNALFLSNIDGSSHSDLHNYSDLSSQISWNVTSVSAVPEPEEWAMMIIGLGLVALQVRNKKTKDNAVKVQ